MLITEKNIFLHCKYKYTFLNVQNEVQNIDEADYVFVCGYDFARDGFGEKLTEYMTKYKIIVDSSSELIGGGTLDFFKEYKNLSNVTIYANNVEPTLLEDFKTVKSLGCNIIMLPFFLKYYNYYEPLFVNRNLNKKKFLFHMGKPKPYRTALLGLLSYYDLIKKGYVSYFNDNTLFYEDKYVNYYKSDSPKTQQEKVKMGLSKLPYEMVLDVEVFNHDIAHTRNMNCDYHINVDFVLVGESDIREGVFFITEKIGKCVLLDKKFILVGCKGLLKYTKEQCLIHLKKDISHLTDWCDTSYDEIDNIWDRINKVIDIINENI